MIQLTIVALKGRTTRHAFLFVMSYVELNSGNVFLSLTFLVQSSSYNYFKELKIKCGTTKPLGNTNLSPLYQTEYQALPLYLVLSMYHTKKVSINF